jgi:hypothetical protein
MRIGQLFDLLLFYQFSIMYLVMKDSCLLYHVSFNPIMAPSVHHSSRLSLEVFNVLLHSTYLMANSLQVFDVLLHLAYSLANCLELLDVLLHLAYSLANCLTCYVLINYQSSI